MLIAFGSQFLCCQYALFPFTGIYDDERIKPCNWDSIYGFQFLGEVEHFHLPAWINSSVLFAVKSLELSKIGAGKEM